MFSSWDLFACFEGLFYCLFFLSRETSEKIIILVASNCQVRYEIKLEAMIQLFGMGTEMLLILAAAGLRICGVLRSRRLHADPTVCGFGT